MERGIVGTEQSAVEVGGLFVLQFGGTRVGTFLNFNRQHVHALAQVARHVGLATHEGTLDAVHLLPVEPDVGLPVDAIEAEEHALPLHLAGHAELAAIPEVAVEERLARHKQVVVVVGIGQCTGVDVGHEHRCGHRGHHPLRGVEARRGNLRATCRHLRSPLQSPVAAVEQELAILPTSLGMRLCHQSAAPHHLNFREHGTLHLAGRRNEDTHVAGLSITAFAERGRRLSPSGSVVGELQFKPLRLFQPMQAYVADFSRCSKVDGSPFVAVGERHPRAREAVRRQQVFDLAATERDGILRERPVDSSLHQQLHAQIAERLRLTERKIHLDTACGQHVLAAVVLVRVGMHHAP